MRMGAAGLVPWRMYLISMHLPRDLDLLRKTGIELILVDVGASFAPFPPFRPLLPAAVYLGFDPDLREIHQQKDKHFHRYMIINKAVVPDDTTKSVKFFLTRHPACSSTLRPKQRMLMNFMDASRFEVVDTVEAESICLNGALHEVGLKRIDWIKLDSQGIDLRLIESLDSRVAGELMAIDAEPGLDAYYEGEDTFSELHCRVTKRGFWLADLDLGCQVRLPREILGQVLGVEHKVGRLLFQFTFKGSPTSASARYLRTLESLSERAAERNAYLRLWACAFFSGNYPYALHVLQACAEGWPEEAKGLEDLRKATIRRLKVSALRSAPQLLRKLSWQNIHRLMIKEY